MVQDFKLVPGMILCHIFRAKRTCIDIRRVVVKLNGSLATQYGMASFIKNFKFIELKLPLLTFPVRQTVSIAAVTLRFFYSINCQKHQND